MANVNDKNDPARQRPGASAPSAAEDAFRMATELHQAGDIAGAERVCRQLIEQFPGSPRAELARTLLAGLQKEKIATLWNAARDARSQCRTQEARTLYERIIEDGPESPEAKSARAEIANCAEIQKVWTEAVKFHAQGDDVRALEQYQAIIDRHPASPEAENAGLLMAILHQNRLMPQGEVSQELRSEGDTPETIVAHLLAHIKATSGSGTGLPPDASDQEDLTRKIENLWMQAVALEQGKNIDEATILYKKIISSSTNGHRVRDAKYRLEKMKVREGEVLRSYAVPEEWGLAPDRRGEVLRKLGGLRTLVIAAVVLVALVAGLTAYRLTRPPSWADVVEAAKQSIVVVKTSTGAGTGFFVSADGTLITNAQIIGRDESVEVRLYSGVLKKAQVVKTGSRLLDIAVLKIDGAAAQFLQASDAERCREGEEVRVLGAPLGMEYFITRGIISHCNLDQNGVRYIQTDPPINVGNSGGPCLDHEGRVIGLSTTVPLGSDARSLNLILPITIVKDFREGKLAALEEALTKKEEELLLATEVDRQRVYGDIESINKRLQQASANELRSYLGRVSDLLNASRITMQQSDWMVEKVKYGPSGSILMADWVQTLALKVAKDEISEESAVKLIKAQYTIQ